MAPHFIRRKEMMFYIFKHWEAELAKVGLISMLLLTLGPLVGQLSAPNLSSMSTMSMSSMATLSHAGHDHSKMMMGMSSSEHHVHMEMNHAWDEACGYCSFFDHFPFLNISLPSIILDHFLPISTPVEFVRSAFHSNSLFLHALKRAPPATYG